MTTQAQSQDLSLSPFDLVKVVLSVLLLTAGVVGFYWYPEYSVLYRALALIGMVLVAAGLFFATAPGRMLWSFIQEARAELRKVTWPTRQETIHTTLMVVVMVVIVGLILWLFDSLFLWLVKLLTGQGV